MIWPPQGKPWAANQSAIGRRLQDECPIIYQTAPLRVGVESMYPIVIGG
jgi:hypothetical protein